MLTPSHANHNVLFPIQSDTDLLKLFKQLGPAPHLSTFRIEQARYALISKHYFVRVLIFRQVM